MISTLATVLSADIIKFLLTFILGGGVWAAIKSIFDAKEVNARAKAVNLKTPLEAESIQIASFEVLVKNLQNDNEVLRNDRNYWKEQYIMVKEQVDRLSDELERQEKANHKLRLEIDELRHQLDKAAQNSPAVKAGREDLTYDEVVTPFPH